MTEIEQLQCEIDVLRGRIAAVEEAAMVICDGLSSYLEAVGVITRPALGELMLAAAKNRRAKCDGSSIELDLIERAARRLFLPSASSVTASGMALQ